LIHRDSLPASLNGGRGLFAPKESDKYPHVPQYPQLLINHIYIFLYQDKRKNYTLCAVKESGEESTERIKYRNIMYSGTTVSCPYKSNRNGTRIPSRFIKAANKIFQID
jgi:hypothetical protein